MFFHSLLMKYLTATRSRKRRSVKRLYTCKLSRPRLEGLEERVLLNAGDLDPAFGTGGLVLTQGGVSAPIIGLALQTDGKILGAGAVGSGGNFYMGVARYNTDGSPDTGFGTNGLASSTVLASEAAVVLQTNGKIVVIGNQSDPYQTTHIVLARLNSDGSLDTTYGSGGVAVSGAYFYASAAALQSDGKIVVAGGISYVNGIYTTYYIDVARFNTDGSLDFETSINLGSQSNLTSVAIQSDGKIVVGGYWSGGQPITDFVTLRFNTDGSRDYTWNGGLAYTYFGNEAGITALAIQPNGMVVAVGYGGSGGLALARYTTTGGPDIVVQAATAYGAIGRAVTLEPDGKIIAAGQATLHGGDFLVVRYNYDGTLDSTFGSGTGYVTTDFVSGSYDNAFAVLLQTDGKIVAAGQGDNTQFGLARYLNGTPPAAASTLSITGFPTSVNSGQAQSFTVTARDAHGNIATGYTGTIHFTSTDSSAGLPADYTFVSTDQGAHTFTATMETTGTQSLTATDTVTGTITGTVTGIQVNPADLLVNGFPSPTASGAAQTFTVTAQNGNGTTATGYTGTIYFISSDRQAVLPNNYTFTAADAGVHTFSATLESAGTQSLTATDNITPSVTGTQAGIQVTAANLLVSGFPSPAQASVAQTFTVTAKNANGTTATGYTGTVHLTSSDSQALLPADYTFTAADAGVHTFSAALYTVGNQSLTATDTVTASITGTQAGILVKPASLLVSGFPSPTTQGVAQSFTVTAENANGTTATAYTGTVHFTSSDSQAVLPADYTFTSTDAGVHTFTATLKTVGTQSLTATDTALTSVTGTQSNITVTAVVADTPAVTGFPSLIVSGSTGTLTVTVYDPSGHIATGYTGTVHFTSSDAQATLPVDYTFTASDAGVHTFSATLESAGTQSLTATDTLTGATGMQSGILVKPAGFYLSVFSDTTTAGVPLTFSVTALNANGSQATGYTGTVHFTSSDSQAVLPADYTFTSADGGFHSFSATFKTAGTQSVTVTDTTVTSVTGSINHIHVYAAAASTLGVTGFPSPTAAGATGTVTVTAKDPYGNTATGYSGTVHFTSSDIQAVLPADYTFVTADAGVHTFSATLKTAGSQSLTATDTATSTITGSQSGITVNPAAASTLVVSGFPSPTVAGVQHSFTVTAVDPYGNTARSYRGTVHFTSSDPRAVLPSNYTFVAADNGVHSFTATLKTAGTQSLTATDTTTSSITGTLNLVVNAAAASHFSVTGFPSPSTAGVAGNFTVTALDPYGNVANAYAGTVHFTSSDRNAVLPANYTFVSTDQGSHSFSAILKTAGTQSFTARDTVTTSITGAQTGIVITPAATAKLKVAAPRTATAGTAFSITVTAQDAYGNTTPGYTGTIHFTSSDSRATLPPDYTFSGSDAGVHVFSNGVTLITAGGRTVTGTDTATSSITGTSASITVAAAALDHFRVAAPSSATAGTAFTITVTAQDVYNNTVTTYTGTVHFTSSDAHAVLPADYTFVSANRGVHTFTVTLKTAGRQSLTVTDTATSRSGSATVTVHAAAASTLSVSAPAAVTAGTAFSFTITAVDAYGNIATSYTGTIHFTSSDTRAVLPANYTFTAADAGVHTFTATLNTSGTQSLTATDTGHPTITGTQSGIQVTAASLDSLFREGTTNANDAEDILELLEEEWQGQNWQALSGGLPHSTLGVVELARLLEQGSLNALDSLFPYGRGYLAPTLAMKEFREPSTLDVEEAARPTPAEVAAAAFSDPQYSLGSARLPATSIAVLAGLLAFASTQRASRQARLHCRASLLYHEFPGSDDELSL